MTKCILHILGENDIFLNDITRGPYSEIHDQIYACDLEEISQKNSPIKFLTYILVYFGFLAKVWDNI